MEALRPGTAAPKFTLPSAPDQRYSLDDFRGRRLILTFYPADFSPVCSDQLVVYQELLPEFRRFGAELVGISVDGVWCHRAFARQRHLTFPLLSDFEPKGSVARDYGVYVHQAGTAGRALFVLDEFGIVHWSYVSPLDVNPGADGILTALEAMSRASVRPHSSAGEAHP
jgi:peroxiredoxin